MAEAPILHYPSSKGDVLISEMAYTHLVNAINKRSREVGNDDRVLGALRDEVARRAREGGPEPTPLQPPARGAPSRAPTEIAQPRGVLAPAADRAVASTDNQPAGAEPDPLKDRLEENHAKLLNDSAQLELEAGALPREVDSDEDCAAINAWVVKAQALCRTAEKERKEEKDYFLRASRTVDAFFGGIATGVQSRMSGLQQRMVPFLQAKRAAEEAQRRQAAEELRRSQEEAQRRENEERAEADRLRAVAEEARQRLVNATTPEQIAEAEGAYREAARAAHLSDQAAEQAVKDARKVEKAAVREEKIVAGEHRHQLGRMQGGGAASRLVTTWKADIHNRGRLMTSLGPLAAYLTEAAIEAALAKAAKADPRPAIPGVDFVEDVQAATRAVAG